MDAKSLKKSDNALKKIQARYNKAQERREQLRSELQGLEGQRDGLIEQLARDEGDPTVLDKHRLKVQSIEDQLQIQDEVLEKIDVELQAARREVYRAEKSIDDEWKAVWRQRFEETLDELKLLLSQAKLCQIESGTGTGGFEFADRVRSLAFVTEPGQPAEKKPRSQHLTNQDRDKIKADLAREEAEKNNVAPEPSNNEHHAIDPALVV